MSTNSCNVISADSHVLEPADLWVSRIEARFQDRAPHVEVGKAGNEFHFEGRAMPMRPMGTPGAMWGKQVEEGRAGGWDPVARLEDMAADGLGAEVLYPSVPMIMYASVDAELQAACFRVYNDWLAEFCAVSPNKLVGIGLVSLIDVEAGVREMRRSAELGLRGVAVWGSPPTDDYSFADKRYDLFWAEAEAMKIPISLHAFTGGSSRKNPVFLAMYSMATQAIQESLATLVFSGVFDRFPGLTVISVENDIGWVPYMMQRMDYGYIRKGGRHAEPFKSGLLPSEQFRRNVRCTFMSDRVGLESLDFTGPEMFMWASDYPHDDSTWPNSMETIEKQFQGIPNEIRDKIVLSNAKDLYKLT